MRYLAPILLLASLACAQTPGGRIDDNCIQMTPEDMAAGKPVPAASGPCAQTPAKPKPKPKPDLDLWTTGTTTLTMQAAESQPFIMIGGAEIIEVHAKNGDLMVRVAQDGRVIYGDKYKVGDSAKTFWEAMAKYYPVVCTKPATMPAKEGQPK